MARRQTPNIDNVRVNVMKCVEFAMPHQVRIFGGPMQAYWPVFSPETDVLPPWNQSNAPQVTLKGKPYSVLERMFLHPSDPVDAGPILLTDAEARGQIRPCCDSGACHRATAVITAWRPRRRANAMTWSRSRPLTSSGS